MTPNHTDPRSVSEVAALTARTLLRREEEATRRELIAQAAVSPSEETWYQRLTLLGITVTMVPFIWFREELGLDRVESFIAVFAVTGWLAGGLAVHRSRRNTRRIGALVELLGLETNTVKKETMAARSPRDG